jgi:hypothetical protein
MSAFDPRDADPLHHVDAEQDLWDPEAGAWVPRQSAVAAMLVALVTGIVAGVLLVFAISAIAGAITAPRSAQIHGPRRRSTAVVRAEPTGAPSGPASQPARTFPRRRQPSPGWIAERRPNSIAGG